MADLEDPTVVHADPNETGVYEIESLCMNCRDEVRVPATEEWRMY